MLKVSRESSGSVLAAAADPVESEPYVPGPDHALGRDDPRLRITRCPQASGPASAMQPRRIAGRLRAQATHRDNLDPVLADISITGSDDDRQDGRIA
jgi:hypothetical protein